MFKLCAALAIITATLVPLELTPGPLTDIERQKSQEQIYPAWPVQVVDSFASGTIIWVTKQAIWVVNPDDLQLELYMDIEPEPGKQINSVMVSRGLDSVFLLQREEDLTGWSPLDEITVTKIDTITGDRRIVLQRKGVLGFDLSPDGTKAVVLHPLEIETFYRGSPTAVCILDVASGECSEIDLDVRRVLWIDETSIIALSTDHNTVFKLDFIHWLDKKGRAR